MRPGADRGRRGARRVRRRSTPTARRPAGRQDAPRRRHRGRAGRHGRGGHRPQRRVDVRGDLRPPVRHVEVRRDARRPQRRPRRHQQVDHERRGAPRRAEVPRRVRRDRRGHRCGPRRRSAALGARREGHPAPVRPAAAAGRGGRDQDPQLLPRVRPGGADAAGPVPRPRGRAAEADRQPDPAHLAGGRAAPRRCVLERRRDRPRHRLHRPGDARLGTGGARGRGHDAGRPAAHRPARPDDGRSRHPHHRHARAACNERTSTDVHRTHRGEGHDHRRRGRSATPYA